MSYSTCEGAGSIQWLRLSIIISLLIWHL